MRTDKRQVAVRRHSGDIAPATSGDAEDALVLDKGLIDFQNPAGKDFLQRAVQMAQWVDASSERELFQFLRHHRGSPGTTAAVTGWGGHSYEGINLASQDYLGLAKHPAVVQATIEAIARHGTHSAGSEPMGGGLIEGKRLESDLAEYLGHGHVVLFPTGWAAGYGSIKGIVRPHDFVVIDALAHDCLQHGARASTPNVVLFSHNDLDSLQARLARVRAKAPNAAILVITESLFSMDSDHPDFTKVVAACREAGAFLMVDVAHDMGLLGTDGRGILAEQGVLTDVDFIVGSFSKSFATIGGFIATHSKGISYMIRGYSGSYTFSNYLTPGQIAAAKEALRIVNSQEGVALRSATLQNARLLRSELEKRGHVVLGRESSMVLPLIGPEPKARMAYRLCLKRGVLINNIEYPACRRGSARLRAQVQPGHSEDQILEAAQVISDAIDETG